MLTQRLHELTELGFIRRNGLRYALTEEGERLRPVLDALHDWGLAIASERGVALVSEPATRSAARGRSVRPA
ncbi:MAG: winged helix-turn-helix transcriptional regulator [Myxococcales bacterium]